MTIKMVISWAKPAYIIPAQRKQVDKSVLNRWILLLFRKSPGYTSPKHDIFAGRFQSAILG